MLMKKYTTTVCKSLARDRKTGKTTTIECIEHEKRADGFKVFVAVHPAAFDEFERSRSS